MNLTLEQIDQHILKHSSMLKFLKKFRRRKVREAEMAAELSAQLELKE